MGFTIQPTNETSVVVNGENFDLKDMTEERGTQLYNALGTLDKKNTKLDYQALANTFADLAKNIHKLISIPGPTDKSPVERLMAVMDAIKNGTDKAGSAISDEMKKFLDTDQGKEIKNIFANNPIAETADFFGDVGAFFSNAAKPFTFAFKAPGRFLDAAISTGSLAKGNVFDSLPTDAQAKALGAAYAACMYAEMDAPYAAANKTPDSPDFFGGLWARVQGAGDWLWRSGAGKYVCAFFETVNKKFFGKGDGKTWGECWSEAIAEAEKTRADTPELTYEQRWKENLTAKVQDRARGVASNILEKAGHVAGRSTTDLAAAIKNNGAVYSDFDAGGTWHSLTFDDKGQPKPEVVTDKQTGKPLTSTQDVSKKWGGFFDTFTPEITPSDKPNHNKAAIAGLIVGAPFAADAWVGFAKGALSRVMGDKRPVIKEMLDDAKKLYEKGDAAAKGSTGLFKKAPDPTLAQELKNEAGDIVDNAKKLTESRNKLFPEKTVKFAESGVGKDVLAIEKTGWLRFGNKVGYWLGSNTAGRAMNGTLNVAEKIAPVYERNPKLGAALPWSGALLSGASFGYDLISDAPLHEKVRDGSEFATISGFTAAGARFGRYAGPEVSAVFAAGGAMIGWGVSLFTSDKIADATVGKEKEKSTEPDPGLALALTADKNNVDPELQKRLRSSIGFNKVTDVKGGGTYSNSDITSPTNFGTQNTTPSIPLSN